MHIVGPRVAGLLIDDQCLSPVLVSDVGIAQKMQVCPVAARPLAFSTVAPDSVGAYGIVMCGL